MGLDARYALTTARPHSGVYLFAQDARVLEGHRIPGETADGLTQIVPDRRGAVFHDPDRSLSTIAHARQHIGRQIPHLPFAEAFPFSVLAEDLRLDTPCAFIRAGHVQAGELLRSHAPDRVADVNHHVMLQIVELVDGPYRHTHAGRVHRWRRAQGRNLPLARGQRLVSRQAGHVLQVAVGQSGRNKVCRARGRDRFRRVRLRPHRRPIANPLDAFARADVAEHRIVGGFRRPLVVLTITLVDVGNPLRDRRLPKAPAVRQATPVPVACNPPVVGHANGPLRHAPHVSVLRGRGGECLSLVRHAVNLLEQSLHNQNPRPLLLRHPEKERPFPLPHTYAWQRDHRGPHTLPIPSIRKSTFSVCPTRIPRALIRSNFGSSLSAMSASRFTS